MQLSNVPLQLKMLKLIVSVCPLKPVQHWEVLAGYRKSAAYQVRLSNNLGGLQCLIRSISILLNGSCNIMDIYICISKLKKRKVKPMSCLLLNVYIRFLYNTYEFVSFEQDKMKQTELGEVKRTLCQEKREKREGSMSNE